jgi:uncharacterized protein
MVISRTLSAHIQHDIKQDKNKHKIAILYGPRQIGKTTLAREIVQALAAGKPAYYYDCDLDTVREEMARADLAQLGALVQNYDLVVFDEAQRVADIGLKLKILHDHFPQKMILATGSSSLDLANRIAEPLTGRHRAYPLHPISEIELRTAMNPVEVAAGLEQRMIYGAYPEVITTVDLTEKRRMVQAIAESYTFKDVLTFSGLKNAEFVRNLLKLLAFQVGSEVSLNELGNSLGADGKTVQKYLNLLTQTFVIYPLAPWFGAGRFEQRKTVTRFKKYYFYDLGIRNALINNFNPLALRDDAGALWENYLLNERIKAHQAYRRDVALSFWRTREGVEVDLIEQQDGDIRAFEFKYGKARVPATRLRIVREEFNSELTVIVRNNYGAFVADADARVATSSI